MKPPVEAPTSTQSRPAGSTPSPSSPCASFSPPRETYGGGALDRELGVLVHLVAGLVVPVDEAGEHECLRLRPRLGEPALDEQDVEALLHARVTRLCRPARRSLRPAARRSACDAGSSGSAEQRDLA